MLAASLTSLLLPALALAAPAKRTWEHADHHDSAGLISSGVFEFTSTYVAHASADTMCVSVLVLPAARREALS